MLKIDLDKEGSFRLHFDSYSVLFPNTDKGAEVLHHVLFMHGVEAQRKASLIATEGSPTQSMVDALLKGLDNNEKQLAGDSRRWEEIQKATGVRVRKFDSRRNETNITLEDLDL